MNSFPVKGDIITMNIDGSNKHYRVLNANGTTIEVVSMSDIGISEFDAAGESNTYSGSTLDTYLNTTYYNKLTTTAKNAIVDKNITQYQYRPKSVKEVVGNRHIYALDIDDIETYLGKSRSEFSDTDIWKMFWNDEEYHGEYLWLRSAYADDSYYAWLVDGGYGFVNFDYINFVRGVRAAFVIDLSKISYIIIKNH